MEDSALNSRREKRRLAVRLSYRKHRERRLAADHSRREANKEKYLAREASYRERNYDTLLEKSRAYAKSQPERRRAAMLKYRIEKRDRYLEMTRVAAMKRAMATLTVPQARIRYLAGQCVTRSRKKGREWSSGFADHLIQNPPTHCPCCKRQLNYSRGQGKNPWDTPSIDRIDNSRGYVSGNVDVICRECNTEKRTHSFATLARVHAYMSSHQKGEIDYYGLILEAA